MVRARLRQTGVCRGWEDQYRIARATRTSFGEVRLAAHSDLAGDISPDFADSNLGDPDSSFWLLSRGQSALALDGQSDDRAALLHGPLRREAGQIPRYGPAQVGLLHGPFVRLRL